MKRRNLFDAPGFTTPAVLAIAASYCVTKSCYVPIVDSGQEIDVNHGIVDVFAFQEALLLEAAFGLALLTMIWIGFRRWLQHKERMGQLIADQTAERSAEYGAHRENVEARLKALEQLATDDRAQPIAQIDTPGANALADPNLKSREVHPKA